MEMVERDGKVGVRWNLRRGQRQALQSKKRFVLVLAGWQAGKTECAVPWLWREMAAKGPGDYLVASPTYPLMMKKVLPVFTRFFAKQLQWGRFISGKNVFMFSEKGCMTLWGRVPDDPPRVLFGHASDAESLESATIKAAWLDECGMGGFPLGSYEAILGRLSIYQGRVLMTSRPYGLGWMKQLLWDPWEAAGRNHPEIDVINFRSIDNPAFPEEEYYRAKKELPAWRFRMAYDGLFSRPAGLIYTSFDETRHKIPRFAIPPQWRRFVGIDFGGVNTAAVYLAEEMRDGRPTGRFIAYREYRAGERSAAEHCFHMMMGDAKNPPEPRTPTCAGGSKSEGQWRREFANGGTVNGQRVRGLQIYGPKQSDVEVGINRVFAAFALNKLAIFDDLHGLLDELLSYGRELDEAGNVTAKIDNPHDFHGADALRYIVNHLQVDKPRATFSGTVVARPGLGGFDTFRIPGPHG